MTKAELIAALANIKDESEVLVSVHGFEDLWYITGAYDMPEDGPDAPQIGVLEIKLY